MRLARGPARSPPERRDRRPWRQIAQYLDVGISTGVGGSSKRGAIYKPPALDGLCSAKAGGAAPFLANTRFWRRSPPRNSEVQDASDGNGGGSRGARPLARG